MKVTNYFTGFVNFYIGDSLFELNPFVKLTKPLLDSNFDGKKIVFSLKSSVYILKSNIYNLV